MSKSSLYGKQHVIIKYLDLPYVVDSVELLSALKNAQIIIN